MALFTKQIRSLNFCKHIIYCSRQYGNTSRSNIKRIHIIKYALFGSGVISGVYIVNKYITANKSINIIPDIFAKDTELENNFNANSDDSSGGEGAEPAVEKLPSSRELRFLQFATLELDGVVFMTPMDFLLSVTDDMPRARTNRKALTNKDVDEYLAYVPNINRKSGRLFRDLGDKGLISYTEYLFLICVLTRPKSSFKIAFNMFDMDGNEKVDRKEFLVMERILSHLELIRTLGSDIKRQTAAIEYSQFRNRDNIWKLLKSQNYSKQNGKPDSVYSARTTLSKYFFGNRGNMFLHFDNFSSFMINLQQEVLELEFNDYSKGMPTISEYEFGKVLMRYTILSQEDQRSNLDRLTERIPDEAGIDFVEFKKFSEFLNNLDDFSMAMKMFSYAGKPITQDEFRRAAMAVTGQNLSSNLVNVVFQLFDKDGDGRLSQREFITVMKDRIHRGYRTKKNASFWKSYRKCIANEIKQM